MRPVFITIEAIFFDSGIIFTTSFFIHTRTYFILKQVPPLRLIYFHTTLTLVISSPDPTHRKKFLQPTLLIHIHTSARYSQESLIGLIYSNYPSVGADVLQLAGHEPPPLGHIRAN